MSVIIYLTSGYASRSSLPDAAGRDEPKSLIRKKLETENPFLDVGRLMIHCVGVTWQRVRCRRNRNRSRTCGRSRNTCRICRTCRSRSSSRISSASCRCR